MKWANLFDYFSKASVLPPVQGNELEGKKLKYLIGADWGYPLDPDYIYEVGYGAPKPAAGLSIAYANLFDEENTGRYGPYLHDSDTAEQYNEGQIDPKGPGWERNLRDQFATRKRQGHTVLEIDNPDAYLSKDVLRAYDLAATYGFKVIAKNPKLCDNPLALVNHPAVAGIIVEQGAGKPLWYAGLERTLPIWFVYFKPSLTAARAIAQEIAHNQCKNMFVTYSRDGEYTSSEDIV
jgi:hypothetical protein